MKPSSSPDSELPAERWALLHKIEGWLEWPMVLLGLIWLVLLVTELVWGISDFLYHVGQAIWIIFIADFVLRFALAPSKGKYLRSNWLTAIALVLPAFRAVRAFRALRAIRGLRLARVITGINRGMGALGRSMGRRGFPYVLALTLVVLVLGAAGMYAFEGGADGAGLSSYAEALWWTAMLLTTMGSGYWPQSSEGRALTLILSLYGLGILGYLAASLASFFIGRDAEDGEGEVASEVTLREIKAELMALRAQLERGAK